MSEAAKDNLFRFEGFYFDSGVKTYDMHARHYRPENARFLSRDLYASAAGYQALQADPPTQDRCGFEGANPTTNVEFDGHVSKERRYAHPNRRNVRKAKPQRQQTTCQRCDEDARSRHHRGAKIEKHLAKRGWTQRLVQRLSMTQREPSRLAIRVISPEGVAWTIRRRRSTVGAGATSSATTNRRCRPSVRSYEPELEGSVAPVTTALAEHAGVSIRAVGGLKLIAAEDAPAFLDACSGVGTRVLGFEGFRAWDGVVEPDMNAIADLSDVLDPDESVTAARGFISAAASDLFFEFTLS